MRMSIEEAERGVQKAFEEALAATKRGRRFCKFEAELWARLLALGCALTTLFLTRAVLRPRAAEYTVGGKRYVLAPTDRRSTDLGTRFGKVQFTRPIGRRVGAPRAAADLPIDRELGLCGGFSIGVVTMVARLCAQLAYATARDTFEAFCSWKPSQRAVLRILDAVGGRARAFLDQAPPPDDDGEVLVIQVDGKGAPTISSRERARRARPRRARKGANRRHMQRDRRRDRPRVRRRSGEKSKNAKVAVVGVLYTLRKMEDGSLDGPLNKRVIATFVSYRALFEWLHPEAVKRGYGTDRFERVLFLADGADVIWDLQKEFFPDAEVALDWYHVVEKLWVAGKAIHRVRGKKLDTWIQKQKGRLLNGSFDAVITSLGSALDDTPVTGPGNKYRRTVLSKTINYFEKNRHRMRYGRLRRLDLDIGTGVVEGAVRHVVGMRFDGPGMRWGLDRLERVLHLRCVLVNGLWNAFESFIAKENLALAAQPQPARTHDAKPAKRAA